MTTVQLNRLYMAYLEHSIRYYEHDEPVISDELYDRLCAALLRHWDGFQHSLKHLTDADALRAGTGYQLTHHPALGRVRAMMRLAKGATLLETFGQTQEHHHGCT